MKILSNVFWRRSLQIIDTEYITAESLSLTVCQVQCRSRSCWRNLSCS